MGICMYYLTILAIPSLVRVRCHPLFQKLSLSASGLARLVRPRSVDPWFRVNMTHTIFKTHSIPMLTFFSLIWVILWLNTVLSYIIWAICIEYVYRQCENSIDSWTPSGVPYFMWSNRPDLYLEVLPSLIQDDSSLTRKAYVIFTKDMLFVLNLTWKFFK